MESHVSVEENMTMFAVIAVLVFYAFVYMAVSFAVDAILTRANVTARPWYFLWQVIIYIYIYTVYIYIYICVYMHIFIHI